MTRWPGVTPLKELAAAAVSVLVAGDDIRNRSSPETSRLHCLARHALAKATAECRISRARVGFWELMALATGGVASSPSGMNWRRGNAVSVGLDPRSHWLAVLVTMNIATIPNSAKWARIALITEVCWRMNKCRVR